MEETEQLSKDANSVRFEGIVSLPERVIELCEQRGWSMNWDARLAYLALEASEFCEAVRGKKGDKVEEAGDVLITALALIVGNGVSIEEANEAAHKKINGLIGAPRYEGEEYSEAN